MYLNDAGLEGGETCFYAGHGAAAAEVARITPRAGASLASTTPGVSSVSLVN